MKETLSELLSITQAANELSVSQYTIREFIKKGKVKYIKSGKKYLIIRESLCEYLIKGDAE